MYGQKNDTDADCSGPTRCDSWSSHSDKDAEKNKRKSSESQQDGPPQCKKARSADGAIGKSDESDTVQMPPQDREQLLKRIAEQKLCLEACRSEKSELEQENCDLRSKLKVAIDSIRDSKTKREFEDRNFSTLITSILENHVGELQKRNETLESVLATKNQTIKMFENDLKCKSGERGKKVEKAKTKKSEKLQKRQLQWEKTRTQLADSKRNEEKLWDEMNQMTQILEQKSTKVKILEKQLESTNRRKAKRQKIGSKIVKQQWEQSIQTEITEQDSGSQQLQEKLLEWENQFFNALRAKDEMVASLRDQLAQMQQSVPEPGHN